MKIRDGEVLIKTNMPYGAANTVYYIKLMRSIAGIGLKTAKMLVVNGAIVTSSRTFKDLDSLELQISCSRSNTFALRDRSNTILVPFSGYFFMDIKKNYFSFYRSVVINFEISNKKVVLSKPFRLKHLPEDNEEFLIKQLEEFNGNQRR